MTVVYANRIETPIRNAESDADNALVTRLLMGTWLRILNDNGAWLEVRNRADTLRGFVRRAHVSARAPLKIFYVDVGQGDGAIIESPQGIVLIDGGPNQDYYRTLRARAEAVIADSGGPVHIDAIVMSHPDDDHFIGLTHLLRDTDFTFGRIYHNGIIRFRANANRGRLDLGTLRDRDIGGQTIEVVSESYNEIDSVQTLLDAGDLMTRFGDFWAAALAAHQDGRLQHGCRRLTHRDDTLPGFGGDPADGLRIEVLGPVVTSDNGRVEFRTFPDPEEPHGAASDSHTINGHSIVLKLIFGDHSFLFGGDLNIPAQQHLLQHYANDLGRLRVDVNKACHHGSSDFSVPYLREVLPHATVFSSGEQRLHDHPLPDSLGAAARHTRGELPLLFSTELARTGIRRGDINARSNGQELIMAQKKERNPLRDPWHSFEVPFQGRFPDSL